MENYLLREDEVVLYKGTVLANDKKTNLILTNINIVFISVGINPFGENAVTKELYPVNEIKIYEGIPQIKPKDREVEIYFKTGEKNFSFESKKELHLFLSEATKLLTGKTGAERNAEKVKNAIGLVNDTLGVDIVKATGEVAKDGVLNKVFAPIGKIGKSLFSKKKK